MRFPAFMFWPERYWLDTYDLSDAEHGRYLRVLILMWNTPRCRIPCDPGWIAAKTGRSVQAFETEIKPILLRFCKSDGGCWWQTKLLAEYERCERLSSRGRAGGNALAKKKKDTSQKPAKDSKQAHAPTPTPTPTPIEEVLFPDGNKTPGDGWPTDFREQFWQRYPKRVEKKAAMAKLETVKKYGNVEWDRFIAAVDSFAAHTAGTEWRYIKAPLVWLNKGCWDDELKLDRGGSDGKARSSGGQGGQGKHRTFASFSLEQACIAGEKRR